MKDYRKLFIYIILLQFVFISQLLPQKVEVHNVSENGIIKNWIVAGPFPSPLEEDQSKGWMKGFDHDFLNSIGGEEHSKLSSKLQIEFNDFDGAKNNVETFSASSDEQGVLSFDKFFGETDYKVAYLYTELFSDREQNCTFLLGSDDGVKVWLNNNLIHTNDVGRGITPREDIFGGKLKKGNNRLLVKVSDFVRGWGAIVEVLDSVGYLEYEKIERDREDFYEFMNSKLVVKTDWESSITFYAGDKFPKLVWDKPYLVEKVAGPVEMKIRWFNSALNEVEVPKEPGAYAYYAEGVSEKGYKIRRAATLYAYPNNWMGWSESPNAELEFMPVSTFEKSLWIKNQDAITKYVGRMVNRSSLTQAEASVLMAFVDSQNDKDAVNRLNTPIIKDGDYHIKLKTKILNTENKWGSIKAPKKSDKTYTVLHSGNEEEAGVKKGTASELRNICDEWFAKSNQPFDLLIARNGVIIIHEAFGEDGYGKFTTEMPTEIASTTKMFTGLIFAQFVDQGLINIDDNVGKFLPEFETGKPNSLTLRNCFTHTSGLFGHGAWGGVQNPWMDNSVASLIPSLPVNKIHLYNGIGYNLAGKVMEIVSNKSIFRLFREHLFDPLEMNNTFNEEDLAYGTQSTAYDLALVGQMVLNKGKYGNLEFFSEKTLDQLLPKPLNTWYPDINQDWGIGFTWLRQNRKNSNDVENRENPYILGKNTVGHGSATSTILRVDFDNNLVIAQSRRDAGEYYEKYLEKLLLALESGLIN